MKSPLFGSGRRFRNSLFYCLLLLLVSQAIPACSTLPDFSHILQREKASVTATPGIRDHIGALTPEKSRAIFAELALKVSDTDILTRHTRLLELLSDKPLTAGNRATLLINRAETFRAMLKEAETAVDHINFETFTFEDDPVGMRFSTLLRQKSAAGLDINILYDDAGSWRTSPRFFRELSRSGIRLLKFNPINPFELRTEWSPFARDHRKLLIIDGRTAFTGGVNIAGKDRDSLREIAMEDNVEMPYWRDTDVCIEGPAVADFQHEFTSMWAGQGGPLLTGKTYFPLPTPQGSDLVRTVASTPGSENRDTYLMYLSAIHFSERRIYLTDAYFAPDDQVIDLLCAAAKRGVDVRVIVPTMTDHRMVLYAGRYSYSRLLRAGVKLYERRDVLLHAKTAVIDGVWSTVGSANLDMWSSLRDYELNAVIIGPEFADGMEAQFARDLEACNAIYPSDWEKRPDGDKLKEWFAHMFNYWL